MSIETAHIDEVNTGARETKQATLSIVDVISPGNGNSGFKHSSKEATDILPRLALSSPPPVIRQECTPENINRLRHDWEEKQRVSQMSRTEQDRARAQADAMRAQQQLQMTESSCRR